jgi:hypothetical protein
LRGWHFFQTHYKNDASDRFGPDASVGILDLTPKAVSIRLLTPFFPMRIASGPIISGIKKSAQHFQNAARTMNNEKIFKGVFKTGNG